MVPKHDRTGESGELDVSIRFTPSCARGWREMSIEGDEKDLRLQAVSDARNDLHVDPAVHVRPQR